jgi:large subunit ribosomal protein L5
MERCIAFVRAAANLRATRRRERSTMAERLKEKYEQQIRPQLQSRFGYENVNQIPKLEKVVVNMSVGEAIVNPKSLDAAVSELAAITGQRPVVTKAKKSIAAFKLREGTSIGAKVTLRGDRMYVFVDKLFNVVLPRIRDFRGLPGKSFDGRGNYNLGLREQLVFPEVNYDKVDKARGMDVTIVTTAKTDEEASEFLVALGLPLAKAPAR